MVFQDSSDEEEAAPKNKNQKKVAPQKTPVKPTPVQKKAESSSEVSIFT